MGDENACLCEVDQHRSVLLDLVGTSLKSGVSGRDVYQLLVHAIGVCLDVVDEKFCAVNVSCLDVLSGLLQKSVFKDALYAETLKGVECIAACAGVGFDAIRLPSFVSRRQ